MGDDGLPQRDVVLSERLLQAMILSAESATQIGADGVRFVLSCLQSGMLSPIKACIDQDG
jgi:hypothetical protein